MAIMDFIQRFNNLQVQRETGNELIKVRLRYPAARPSTKAFNSNILSATQDLLIYIERVENGLQNENARLTKELEDAHLDLEDSKRSRRDLQQQLNMMRQSLGQSLADCEFLRVG